MADASFEDVLSKLNFSPVDSKDFLTLLFQTDEKGFDYLSGLKKQFKEKYVIPTFKKAQNVYEKIGKNLTEAEKEENLKLIGDPFDIISLKKEYKEKTKKILEEKLKDLKSSTTPTSSEVQNTLKSSSFAAVIPDQAKTSKEQATFTEKIPEVTLSEESIEDLKELLNLNLKNLKISNKTENKPETLPQSDLLKTLGILLGVGGVAGILISMFWDKIKPWLEDKFDIDLDFLDKFKGTLNAIGKFFTTGGISIAGTLLKIQGKVIQSLGELIESSVGGIFKVFLGEGAEKGIMAGAAKIASGGTLYKIAGKVLGGIGIVTLKSLPVIGALISFGFAYNRFQEGDNIGGIIDIVAGIGNLLTYTPLAPLALPISLGATVLNAFLDYNEGEGTIEQKQQNKLNFIGKIAEFIRTIPFVGWIMNFAQGFYEIGSGNFKEGIDYLMMQPFLGPFPAIIKTIMDSTTTDEQGNTRFSFDTFSKKIKSNLGKWLLNQVPNWFGERKILADFLGIDYNETTGEVSDASLNVDSINQAQQEMQKQASQKFAGLDPKLASSAYKQTKDELAKLEEEYKNSWSSMSMFGTNIGSLFGTEMEQKIQAKRQEMVEIGKKMNEGFDEKKENFSTIDPKETINDNIKAENVERQSEPSIDLPPPKDSSPLLFDKLKNMDSSPDLLNLRSDANLDQGIKQLTGIVESVNKGIFKMTGDLTNTLTKQLGLAGGGSMAVVGGQGGSNKNDIILSGSRDSIYELRSSWWRRTANLRETV